MFLIGTGKADITAFERGAGMLGYGLYSHIALDVETPLYARAFVFEDTASGVRLVLVNCELCFITPSVKSGVVQRLADDFPEYGIGDDNLMLTAQHTHCAPAGYSYHPIYNVSVPGFVPHIFDTIVDGIILAISSAWQNRRKGQIHLGSGRFADDIPVSFNRTVNSYNQNPEVTKYSFEQRHLAVDREMTLLKFTNEQGDDIGSVNWFAVHTTSLPNTYTKICSDNKGFAAELLEQDIRKKSPDYIAAFAQGACGDVSARSRYNPKLPFQRGKYEGEFPDDLKSSRFNGQLQYEKAREINDQASQAVGDELGFVQQYLDFSHIDIRPDFVNGQTGCVTAGSVMGVAFLEGSKMDGPGMPPILAAFTRSIANSVRAADLRKAARMSDDEAEVIRRKYLAQGNKHLAMETGYKRILGGTDLSKFFLPKFSDPMIRNLKTFGERGAFDIHAWAPQILPVQLFRIGNIALVAIPFEITTAASWRLRKTIEDKLFPNGFERVILCPYANAYNGYITTFEEYQVQDYEGGHNVFGQWSLNALQQVCSDLCDQLLSKPADRHIPPLSEPAFSPEYLNKMAYHKSRYYQRIEKKSKRQKARQKK